MLGKACGKEMHINTIPMFYPTCKERGGFYKSNLSS
jgi:hypothetical protein